MALAFDPNRTIIQSNKQVQKYPVIETRGEKDEGKGFRKSGKNYSLYKFDF